jgi:hypothetical protein
MRSGDLRRDNKVLWFVRVLLIVCLSPMFFLAEVKAAEDEFQSIYSAAIANILAVRNFDAIVRENYRQVPHDPEDAEFTPVVNVTKITRIVVDNDEQRCIYVNRVFKVAEGDKPLAKALQLHRNNPLWQVGAFDRKIASNVSPFFKKTNLKDFMGIYDEWFSTSNVPRLETLVWYPIGIPLFGGTLEQSLEKIALKPEDVTTRVLPDGSTVLSWVSSVSSEKRMSIHLNSRSGLPDSWHETELKGGTSTTRSKQQNHCAEIRGVYRLNSCTREFRDGLIQYFMVTDKYDSDPKKSKRFIPMDNVGTVSIEWLQFNESKFHYPTYEELGSDRVSWAKFVQLDNEGIELDLKALAAPKFAWPNMRPDAEKKKPTSTDVVR